MANTLQKYRKSILPDLSIHDVLRDFQQAVEQDEYGSNSEVIGLIKQEIIKRTMDS